MTEQDAKRKEKYLKREERLGMEVIEILLPLANKNPIKELLNIYDEITIDLDPKTGLPRIGFQYTHHSGEVPRGEK